MAQAIQKTGNKWLAETGDQALFMADFVRNLFKKGFEWNELVRQCYMIGYRSLMLTTITGFILGFVITVQSAPTMKAFGAESFIPNMVIISIVREIGPVIIALTCAGKIASGIGAELASMKVTEQIDAMEVSGASPVQYLVVTRILACTLMVPLLTLMADTVALWGGYFGCNLISDVSFILYFNKSFSVLLFTDLIPATIKTVFFGFAIGFVGCYKGYNATNGTEGVGVAANAAVVSASLWVIVMDAIAAQLTNLFAYN